MSRRFLANVSKYRNAVGKAAKHEDTYADVRVSTATSSDSCQLIKTSSSWITFKHGSAGSIGLLPVGKVGRVGAEAHVLNANGLNVSDWEFSPFDPDLLFTGSEQGEASIDIYCMIDLPVKVWRISHKEGEEISTTLLQTISTGTGKPIEAIVHHPTATGILTTASQNLVQIWDISNKEDGSTLNAPAFTLTHPNTVTSISWKADGTLIASTCKDSKLRVYDVRSQETPVQEALAHGGTRSSRVVWLGEKDIIFTVGFNKMRDREIAVWNANDLTRPLELKRMDSSTGLMLPIYDEDTSMLYLPSKGEAIVRWIEISESSPYMTEGMAFTAQSPIIGAALLPKQNLNVMQTEVARIMAVHTNAIWPINVNIPRKSYLDFHSDLYPETKSSTPGSEALEWLQGENKPVPRISLDPGMAGRPAWTQRTTTSTSSSSSSVPRSTQSSAAPPVAAVSTPKPGPTPASVSVAAASTTAPSAAAEEKSAPSISTATVEHQKSGPKETEKQAEASSTTPPVEPSSQSPSNTTPPSSARTPVSTLSPIAQRLAAQKTSKFRFLSFKPYHVNEHFESISGLSINTTPECNLIEASLFMHPHSQDHRYDFVNPKLIALPLHGPGGRIGLLKTCEPGRVGNKIPTIVCSSDLLGYKFDPFNHRLLVTATDDTKIKGWLIPDSEDQSVPAGSDSADDTKGGNAEDITKPDWVLSSPTMDKISMIKFHPHARDVLLSASMDRDDPTMRLWDLKAKKEVLSFKGHKDVIFSADFNYDGTKIISVCRDKKIRVWDALSGVLLQEGLCHESLKSSRVLWLGESDLVASVGFGKGSQREILIFDSKDLSKGPIDKKSMGSSPGILVPHYDPDTSILGISARGDRVMKHFEIHIDETKTDLTTGKSLLVEVASLEQGTLQQDVAYLPKRYCNVKEIELAKMYRLTYNSVEVIGVSVPRNKKEYFQDELFPDTVDVETPSLEASEFFAGQNVLARLKKISLCPPDMEPLSHHVAVTPSTPKSGGNSLEKFLRGKEQAAEDDRKRQAMERMFDSAKESKADRVG
ncbi:Coronin-7 [Lunasporangiospora selenospora]|uniref:Coronin n=1 Tax=Lunasporangiospora selenospora TaxID=979761 RepID=A0A9P6FS09_9FUNG|nr:Coronin-7 [Lunasporangiospora selenospora]